MLYELKGKQEEEMKRLKGQYEEADAAKQNCTFRPQLVADPSSDPDNAKRNVEGVQERAMLWQKKKEEKLKAMKSSSEERLLESCTFQPQLVAGSNAHIEHEEPDKTTGETAIASIKSVEQYIEKQKAMREQKEQSQKKAEQYTGSGKLWTKRITMPKAPNFMGKVEKEELGMEPEKVVRHHTSYPKSEAQQQFLKVNKQIENFAVIKSITERQGTTGEQLNPIAEKVEFGEALGMLHKDLMGIQIENPNFQ